MCRHLRNRQPILLTKKTQWTLVCFEHLQSPKTDTLAKPPYLCPSQPTTTPLKTLVDALKNLVTEGNWHSDADALSLRAMDANHVALCDVPLDTEGFEPICSKRGYRKQFTKNDLYCIRLNVLINVRLCVFLCERSMFTATYSAFTCCRKMLRI